MAILAGDGLLNYAFETALKAFDIEPVNPNLGKAMQVLGSSAMLYLSVPVFELFFAMIQEILTGL